jgi:hypothetical protein
MPAAVKLREDYSAAEFRQPAKRSKDANQSRRLLSLAAVREGKDRAEAAKMGGAHPGGAAWRAEVSSIGQCG